MKDKILITIGLVIFTVVAFFLVTFTHGAIVCTDGTNYTEAHYAWHGGTLDCSELGPEWRDAFPFH